jgi:uncharacterized protein with HEPN domain
MQNESAYLSDILQACLVIAEYIEGQSLESFQSTRMLRDAVNYQLMIIGEATRYLTEETKAKMPEIPSPAVRRTRNILVHDYLNVDETIIWETAVRHVPLLADAVGRCLPAQD